MGEEEGAHVAEEEDVHVAIEAAVQVEDYEADCVGDTDWGEGEVGGGQDVVIVCIGVKDDIISDKCFVLVPGLAWFRVEF